jgi:hypothetical protein
MHQVHPNASDAPRQSFWRLYMAVWVVLAGASLAYLAMFSLNPDARRHVVARIQTDFVATSPQPVAEKAPAPDARPELTDKVRALNEELETLRRKLKQAETSPPVDRSLPSSAPQGEAAPASDPVTSAAAEPPAGTSSVTTASIPRLAETAASEPPANTFNPFASSERVVVSKDTRSPETTAETTPPQAELETTRESTPPATIARAPRRDLKGENLAIRPLRPGQLPPLPTPQSGRTATVASTTAEPNRVTGNFPQPTVLNSDSADTRSQPTSSARDAAPNTINRALAPRPTPTSFGAATIRPAQPPSALVLSSASSITGLRANWLLLTSQHGETLARLQPHFVTDPGTGTYRLLAGPVSSAAEADRLCNDLIGQGVPCGVTAYAGSPL